MNPFSKVFEAILESSLMREDLATRWVFLAFILLRDKHHEVKKSVYSISDRAHVKLEDTEKAIERLCSPDLASRGKDHEGRRLLPIEGGWFVVNGEYYRNLMSEEDKREKDRIRQARKRDSHAPSRSVTPQRDSHAPSEKSHIPDPRSQISDPRQGDPPPTPPARSDNSEIVRFSAPGDPQLDAPWMEYQLSGGPDSRRQFDKQIRATLEANPQLTPADICRWFNQNRGRKAWDAYQALVPPPDKVKPPAKPVRTFQEIAAEAEAAGTPPKSLSHPTALNCALCRGSGRTTNRRAVDPSSPYWRQEKPYVEVVVPCPSCQGRTS